MWSIPSALALLCGGPFEGWSPPPDGVLPSNGELVVITETERLPTTGRFQTVDGSPATDAEVVPLTRDTYALVPHTPLQPGLSYTLAVAYDLGPHEPLQTGVSSPQEFTLEDTVDHTPPEAPNVSAERITGRSEWSREPVDFLQLHIDRASARVELEVTEENGPSHVISTIGSMAFGTHDCTVRPIAYSLDASLTLRARNVDWAGNRSDWVDVEITDLPPVRPGCTTSPSSPGLGIATLQSFFRRRGHDVRGGSGRAAGTLFVG